MLLSRVMVILCHLTLISHLMLIPVHVSILIINSQLFDKYYFDRLDFRRGMPRFNRKTGDFMGGMESYYRSHFRPECDYDHDEKTGDEQPLAYAENDYQSPDTENNYYYKPRHRKPANSTSNNKYFSYKNSKSREKLFNDSRR